MLTITEPGMYPDLTDEQYHAQTAWLSNSGIKKLLSPDGCPAKFKHAMDNPGEERKRNFDLGKVVHRIVLGRGADFEVVKAKRRDGTEYDAEDFKSVAAQKHRDAIYEAGRVPILAHELAEAEAMAAAVLATPEGAALFKDGVAEVSLFWIDNETGVQCRARLDWLPNKVKGRRLIVPDLKTAVSSHPRTFAKNAARYGYTEQQVHYSDGIAACDLDPDPAFLFSIVEKDAPHVVTHGQFVLPEDIILARARVDMGRRIYRECMESGQWPGYVSGIADLELPRWHHYDNEDIA